MNKSETPFNKIFQDLQKVVIEDTNDWKDKLTLTAREEMEFKLKVSAYLINVVRGVYHE